MNEVEIIDAPETGLIAQVSDLEVDQETRIALCKSFEPLYKQASEWAEQANAINVTSVDDKEGMKASRELRLNLKGLRVDADKLHKKLKEDSLRRGRAIDGFRNIVKALVIPVEERLQEQEDFAKREREKQIRRLQEERAALLDECDFEHSYMSLGEMKEEAFQGLLTTAKTAHDAKIKAAEEAAAAEAKRIADEAEAERKREQEAAIERARIAEENRLLKIEKDKQEAALQKERDDREKERKALEAKQAKERAAAAAAEKKRKAEADRKLKEQQAATAKAEAAAKALQEAEEKRKREERDRIAAAAAAEKAALQADDNTKLNALAEYIETIELKSPEGKSFLISIIDDIHNFIES